MPLSQLISAASSLHDSVSVFSSSALPPPEQRANEEPRCWERGLNSHLDHRAQDGEAASWISNAEQGIKASAKKYKKAEEEKHQRLSRQLDLQPGNFILENPIPTSAVQLLNHFDIIGLFVFRLNIYHTRFVLTGINNLSI
ncbi:hypothetical protein GOODEAATRI_012413 [Goodea atripinnis]|uniref:Uncharacterized protein n=1 Tax=Goodea atripinnis TaxID=208336 RepID=A0ABV0NJL1_9TELE